MNPTPPGSSPAPPAAADAAPTLPQREVARLRDLSPVQWKSGIAAWLGWLFDGLDMHLYTLVAAPFVMELLNAATPMDPEVKAKSSWIQAAFLIGWALGGGFFGRVGDRLGRSRALCLTILTYALFTGLAFVAQTWWQLLVFRFLAALGIGGEWAVGSSLLSETWPRRWRPWIAAVLQTGVNIGVLGACLAVYLLATLCGYLEVQYQPRWVFLVGVLPALLVFWIRRHVPEPEEWHSAKVRARDRQPRVRELFQGAILPTTLKTIAVCALSLSAWWAFMFWHAQHLRNLPELAGWTVAQREQLVSQAFFLVIAVSIVGNFFGGWLARMLGYRRAIALMFLGFFLAMSGAFIVPRGWEPLFWFWFPAVGFFSGVFGLFTMYLPPLFPTLLRTTGAGFCYNIGRIGAAFGTVFFGLFSKVGDFRLALLYASFLFPLGILVALLLPEHQTSDPPEGA
ncbi:MAG: MFS transporter [Verrucomicrobia bacterium]|nr:MFS transporter [Verrucomicrobiota bacterium]